MRPCPGRGRSGTGREARAEAARAEPRPRAAKQKRDEGSRLTSSECSAAGGGGGGGGGSLGLAAAAAAAAAASPSAASCGPPDTRNLSGWGEAAPSPALLPDLLISPPPAGSPYGGSPYGAAVAGTPAGATPTAGMEAPAGERPPLVERMRFGKAKAGGQPASPASPRPATAAESAGRRRPSPPARRRPGTTPRAASPRKQKHQPRQEEMDRGSKRSTPATAGPVDGGVKSLSGNVIPAGVAARTAQLRAAFRLDQRSGRLRLRYRDGSRQAMEVAWFSDIVAMAHLK